MPLLCPVSRLPRPPARPQQLPALLPLPPGLRGWPRWREENQLIKQTVTEGIPRAGERDLIRRFCPGSCSVSIPSVQVGTWRLPEVKCPWPTGVLEHSPGLPCVLGSVVLVTLCPARHGHCPCTWETCAPVPDGTIPLPAVIPGPAPGGTRVLPAPSTARCAPSVSLAAAATNPP